MAFFILYFVVSAVAVAANPADDDLEKLTAAFKAEASERITAFKEASDSDELTAALRSASDVLSSTKELENWAKAPTDPELNMTPVEMIKRWDYPAEEYTVTTTDGYLLSLQRIPGPRFSADSAVDSDENDDPKPVLFLMHGLLGSATNWISNLPNESFAFVAADAGFDVWLGNARGTTYSKRHTQFSPKDRNFWKFSWDEIAKYDVPAMVDYALWKSKNEQLYYAGHSQGSMVMFAKASEDQLFGKKIKKFFALGPVTTVGHVIGAARLFGKIHQIINAGSIITGIGEFLPKSQWIDSIAKTFCTTALKAVCSNVLFLLAGQDTAQLNQTRLPVYLTHTPAGTSVQNVVHFGQMIESGKFQKHDFGFIGNAWHYGTVKAPEYVVSRMEVPTVLYWGGKDLLADPEDVRLLKPQIRNLKGNYFDKDLDHLDYIWGITTVDKVYKPIIKDMLEEEEKK